MTPIQKKAVLGLVVAVLVATAAFVPAAQPYVQPILELVGL